MRRLATLAALTFALPGFGAPAEPPAVTVRAGAPVVVYDWRREHCAVWDTPDAPLRAFRDASGGIVAFASDSHSRRFVGASLVALRHTCHSSLASGENRDPAAYDGSRYVTAIWSSNGVTVSAVLHEEYHAERFAGACRLTDDMACWYNTLIAAVSTDGSRHFEVAHPPVVIAAAPFRQDVDQGRHRGFFSPSNIVFHNGFYYFLTETTGGRGQADGLCLFRTATVEDPRSWRAFDGRGFGSRARDPYREDTRSYLPCAPVEGLETAGSISWVPAAARFLAVFQTVDDARPQGYTGYAWSRDLLHWSAPRVLWDQPDMSSTRCADRVRYGYPSILDSAGPGRNFHTVGDAPSLFVTRFHVVDCGLPPNRDLLRLTLDIERP